MEQLIMYWKAPDKAYPVELPEGYYIERYKDEEDIDSWIAITRHDLQDIMLTREAFKTHMLDREGVFEENIFFISYGNEKIATVTAVVYPEREEGYVHFVACTKEHRQKGIGRALVNLCLNTFMEKGLIFATLKTDPHRIPAIKSYIRAGFLPILYSNEIEDLWVSVMKDMNLESLDGLDNKGNFIKRLESVRREK